MKRAALAWGNACIVITPLPSVNDKAEPLRALPLIYGRGNPSWWIRRIGMKNWIARRCAGTRLIARSECAQLFCADAGAREGIRTDARAREL
jgi:hypothetical protein